MRREIEEAFDMHAVDIYGLSEVIGPGVANECVETKDGLHIWEDHFYPEIVDPVTGKVLPDGEKGELVFTTLTKEGMPVIRYRTRDLTRLLPGTARTMRRMEKITGRSDDMMIVRGVNVFPTQIEELILKVKGLAPHYQIVLTRSGRLDEMEVLVEAAPAAEASARAGLGRRARPPRQGPDWRQRQDQRDRPRRRRAQPGQGPARGGQAAEGLAVGCKSDSVLHRCTLHAVQYGWRLLHPTSRPFHKSAWPPILHPSAQYPASPSTRRGTCCAPPSAMPSSAGCRPV